MSEVTAGGYYLNPDGKSAHDANGKPLPLRKEETPAPEVVIAETPAPEVVIAETPAPEKVKK